MGYIMAKSLGSSMSFVYYRPRCKSSEMGVQVLIPLNILESFEKLQVCYMEDSCLKFKHQLYQSSALHRADERRRQALDADVTMCARTSIRYQMHYRDEIDPECFHPGSIHPKIESFL